MHQRQRVVYEKFKHSLWKHLTKSIYTNVKEGQQLFIRDLLDSLDDVKDDFKEIYSKFSHGKSLDISRSPKKTRISMRAIKPRPTTPIEKKKKQKNVKRRNNLKDEK